MPLVRHCYLDTKSTSPMARTKNLDREAALRAAMGVFWKHGYAGTSVQHLVSAMGIHRANLYEVFGSKEELFGAVVANYTDQYFETLMQPFGGAGEFPADRSVVAAIGEVLDLVEEAIVHPQRPGCLVETAIICHGAELGKARGACEVHLSRVGAKFDEVIRAGQERGELRQDRTCEELRFVLRGAFCAMSSGARLDGSAVGAQAVGEGAIRAMTP